VGVGSKLIETPRSHSYDLVSGRRERFSRARGITIEKELVGGSSGVPEKEEIEMKLIDGYSGMLPLGVVFDTVKPVRHDYRERNRQQEGAPRQRNAHRLKITRADVPIIFPVTVPVPCSKRKSSSNAWIFRSLQSR
jgi:hypothetical protein